MAAAAVNKFALLGDEDDGDGITGIMSRLEEEAAAAAQALEEELKKKNNGKAPRNGSSADVRGDRRSGRDYQQYNVGVDSDPNHGQGSYDQNNGGPSKLKYGRGRGNGYQQNHGRRLTYRPKYEGESSQNGVGGDYSQGSGPRSNNGGRQFRGRNGGRVFNNQGFENQNQWSENVNQRPVSNVGDENVWHGDAQDQSRYVHQSQGANGGGRRRNRNNGGKYEYRAKAGGKNSGNSVAPNASEAEEVVNSDIAVPVDENGPGTEQIADSEPQPETKATKEEAKRKAEWEARRKEMEEEAKEEAKKMTLAEYEKLTLEKRKALESLGNEKRKVTLDEDFQSMQIIDKKREEVLSMKLSEEKLKRKDSLDKEEEKAHEEKARKVLDIKGFLKPSYGRAGRSTDGSRGAGGRVGVRRERENNPQVKIEDHCQFPSLHTVAKA